MTVFLIAEGLLDELVGKRLLSETGLGHGWTYPRGGWNRIETKIRGFNDSAAGMPTLALLDFMEPAKRYKLTCPSEVVTRLLPTRHPNCLLRIVVNEIESWLLADRKNLAKYLAIDPNHIPAAPELVADPKKTLVSLANQSRRKDIRIDLVPAKGTSASQGRGYNSKMAGFVNNFWQPKLAASHAPSLQRCLMALEALKASLND